MTQRYPFDLRFQNQPEFDPNTVTPGVIGFFATFFVAAAVVLLVIDMTRRVRRMRYTVEIGEKLDLEQGIARNAAADARASDAPAAGDGVGTGPRPRDDPR